jgi:hypothetical protein
MSSVTDKLDDKKVYPFLSLSALSHPPYTCNESRN